MAKLTRKEAKAESRKRLILATISVLRQEGPGGLTTGKIANAAGLSQPSFYVHFKDMDDALFAAADEIGRELREALSRERHRVVERRSRETIHAAYLSALEAFLANPTFTEVILRYRRDDTTPIGRQARALVDAIRGDIYRDVTSHGLDESRLPALDIFVDLLLGMTLTAVEGLLDGRYADRNECAEVLFRAMVSVFTALSTRET
jgi:AcrR family transcriptional regulator